jgi:tetratricopeptide (TPR) repeat protein
LTFWPAGQHLDHDVPFVAGWGENAVLLAAAGHLLLIGAAIFMARGQTYRLAGIGILFFYVAHSIESSIFPIRDAMFEHRMYLPLFGIALAVGNLLVQPFTASTDGLSAWLRQWRVYCFVLFMLMVLALAVTTIQRNQVWGSLLEMTQRDALAARFNPRPIGNYGNLLVEAGQYKEGLDWLRKAMNMRKGYMPPYEITHVMVALRALKEWDKAQRVIDIAMTDKSVTPHERFVLLLQKGGLALDKQQFAQAEQDYAAAQKIFPDDPMVQLMRQIAACRRDKGGDAPECQPR